MTESLREMDEEMGELRQRIAELEASAECYRNLLEHTREAVFVTDLESGRCVQVNRRAGELLGYAKAELLDMSFADLVAPAHREAALELLEGVRDGQRASLHLAAVGKDGAEHNLEATALPLTRGARPLAQIIARDTSAEQAEEFLHILLETVPDFVYFKDRNRRFVVASRSFERLLKREPGEIIGKRDEDLWPPEIGALAIADDLRVIEEGIPVLNRLEGGEVIDGVECWVSTSKLPWRGPDGSIRGLYGISKDITETRRAQVEQSEKRLRQIIDGVFGFVVLCTAEGVLLDANRAPIEAAGLTPGDVAGKPLWETYWWNHDAAVQERLRTVMMRAAAGEVARCEVQARVIDDALIDLDISFAPMTGDDGKVDGIIGFAVNITERKRAEHALRENEERLRLALQASGQGTWSLDVETMTGSFDTQFAQILGYGNDELATRDWQAFGDLMHPDDRMSTRSSFTSYLESGGPDEYKAEFRMRTRSGAWMWCMGTGKIVEWDADQRPRRMVGTHTDISARRHADELLRASLREKETLLREVHHRVKNNLQIISSLLHFQAKRVTEPEHLAAFEEGRKRLLAMVLVHEKLYQSKELSNIDFGDYVRSLVGALLESSDAHRQFNIDVVTDDLSLPIESALPSGMILCELLTNVFKYAYPDGQTGKTNVRVHGEDTTVRMSVADDGVGFPADFDPGAVSSFGWQLIRSLVAQLDGEVQAQTRAGARIDIWFPLPERGSGELMLGGAR